MNNKFKIVIGMIKLRKATLGDRKKAYQWLYYSDFSDFLNKLQGLTSGDIPSYEEFKKDYMDYFFDGSQPDRGCCFIITCKKEGITEDLGIISYTSFHLLDKITEFDIWLKGLRYTGHGYGTKAILALAGMVREFGYDKVIMRPSKHNKRAINSYQKAGFMVKELIPCEYYKTDFINEFSQGDCGPGEDVFMVLDL